MERAGAGPSELIEGLVIRIERLASCWAEAQSLISAEAKEVEPDGRDLHPDLQAMMANETLGTLRVLAARKDGRLIGYLTWMVDFDMEAYGTLIANQTAWYVEPGHYGVAAKMFDFAVEEFRRLGVKFAYWHHTEQGRGKRMGRFFERRGAHLISHNYAMKL